MAETSTPTFSTKTVHDNERIVITPPDPTGWWGRVEERISERTHMQKVHELEEMRASILRHVDNASQRNVAVVWDSKTCCIHCGEPVELGTYDNGEPACCDEAIAEWVASGGVIAE